MKFKHNQYIFVGEYKEKYIATEIDEIKRNQTTEMQKGYVSFRFDNVERTKTTTRFVSNIKEDEGNVEIATMASIVFKLGDEVRLNGKDCYTVVEIDYKIGKEVERTLRKFPGMFNKLAIKILTLK